MINHGRTLLLNRAGDIRPDPTYFLEDYVPADFQPVELTDALSRVYEALIGEDADDAYANYQVWIILRAIHATEYASALPDLDPRITYLRERGVPDFGFKVLSTDQSAVDVHPSAQFYQKAVRRKLYHRWLMTMGAASLMLVTDMTGEGVAQKLVTGTTNLTDPIVLSTTDSLSVRLGAYPVALGAQWDLQGILQPATGLPQIVTALEQLGGMTEDEILGSTVEPYPTFKKLWKEHILLHYRLAGYMLGYIYKTEEVRLNG
jgi:hypothetical protein